jgi:DNA mismatch repair protein MutL
MSNIIRLLPDHVANQIAAGEVVQIPASVVKELIENAVDAGATEVKLILKEAGKTLIQVIDDGKGMSETDARMAFERHATSKISTAEDLFALQTKGFRGEALASIAAIAHVELKTCLKQAELGTHVVIEGSKVVSQEVAVVPEGTSFSVKNLFFNIPARRNFLKSDTVEFRHIVDEFERVALVHHNIHFVLLHNGSEVFNLPASNLRQRIVNVFGGKTNEKLVPVKENTDIVTVEGFIGKPEYAKKSRGEQFFFVNDRFIKSGYLHHAVLSAYEGLLKEGVHPTYFIYLNLPPDTIDINIHPTKTEVKFDDEQALYSILRSTVKHSLGQFNVTAALDFQRDASLDTPYEFKGKEAETPTIAVDALYNPFKQDNNSKNSYNPFEDDEDLKEEKSIKIEERLYGSLMNKDTVPLDLQKIFKSKISSSSFKGKDAGSKQNVNKPLSDGSAGEWNRMYENLKQSGQNIDVSQLNVESEMVTGTLFDVATDNTTANKTFQIHKKYIVSPIKSGMLIIDQGRAHQRILYEKFMENITVHQQASSQQLLFPLTLYYAPYEVEMLKELKELLIRIGFGFEQTGEDYIVISGLPVHVSESEASIVLEDLIADFHNGLPDTTFSQGDRIAKSLAHSLAVKTGTILNEEEQENMVNSLFACKDPQISPFMKPVFITMKVEDIEKKFTL